MRLYLDSSAFVKAFVAEDGRDEVLAALGRADIAATSQLTYVECRAAFARALREGRMSSGDERTATRAMDQRWGLLGVVELDHGVAVEAATLARAHALRAAGAVHLASAILLAGGAPAGTSFACWDAQLAEAAAAAGFDVIPGGD